MKFTKSSVGPELEREAAGRERAEAPSELLAGKSSSAGMPGSSAAAGAAGAAGAVDKEDAAVRDVRPDKAVMADMAVEAVVVVRPDDDEAVRSKGRGKLSTPPPAAAGSPDWRSASGSRRGGTA